MSHEDPHAQRRFNFEGKPHVGFLTQYFSEAAYGRDGELALSDYALVEPLRCHYASG